VEASGPGRQPHLNQGSIMSVIRMLIAAVVALALGALVSHGFDSGTLLSLLTQATIYAVFALGVGLLLRQNGMVSFGHALFFGSAGYVVAILLQLKAVPAEVAIVIAVVGLTVFAFLIGLVIVRVPGVAFGMLTLAVGQMAYLSASRSRGLTGGADGMTVEWPSTLFGMSTSTLQKPAWMLMLSWAVLVVLLLALGLVLRSRFGAITEAVRDNEERARFIGIRTLLPRAALYALSAAVTSVAGVLAALNTSFISPESLHWSLSGVALMMVVVGGTRALWGPALGAVVYFLAKDVLGDHAQHWMAIFGTALIVVIVFAPEGLSGLLRRMTSAVRRGARSPAPAAGRAIESGVEHHV
jgi:branched-chain amino acid transport system permease protein